MKHFFRFLISALILCTSLTSCGNSGGGGGSIGGLGGYNPNPYDCDWHEDDFCATFYSPYLLLPDCEGECEYVFRNQILSDVVLINHSIMNVMNNVQQNFCIGTSFSFKWTASIVSTKSCSVGADQARTITIDQDNYTQRFSFNNIDILHHTPYVPLSNNIYLTDYKHELTFQIRGVHNDYDGSDGSLLWSCTFDEFVPLTGEWQFICPNEGMKAVYTPERHYQPARCIYYQGQYQTFN